MGFPIRKSPDQRFVANFPGLIAGSYVLHRLLVPRHPPCALSSLSCYKDARVHCVVLKIRAVPPSVPRLPDTSSRMASVVRGDGGPRRIDLSIPQDPTVCLIRFRRRPRGSTPLIPHEVGGCTDETSSVFEPNNRRSTSEQCSAVERVSTQTERPGQVEPAR